MREREREKKKRGGEGKVCGVHDRLKGGIVAHRGLCTLVPSLCTLALSLRGGKMVNSCVHVIYMS